jgi:beta-glucanase (GH16 family)
MSTLLGPPPGFTASELVFQDSFAGTLLDPSWNTYMTSAASSGWAAGEPWDGNGAGGSSEGAPLADGGNNADYDQPTQVTVDNGLTLTAIDKSTDPWGQYPYTSGIVDTYGHMVFDGGYLQISMKEPQGETAGAWPAIWLLPGAPAGTTPQWFEIDMQEGGLTDGNANPNDVAAWHLLSNGEWYGGVTNTGINLTSGYVTYGLDWVPGQSITWFINGKEIGQITSAQAQIPNQPMELIMNLGVADSLAASIPHTVDGHSTPHTMTMQVQDVQLYQRPGSGETITGGHIYPVETKY